jgi:FkbM family methyltransferase
MFLEFFSEKAAPISPPIWRLSATGAGRRIHVLLLAGVESYEPEVRSVVRKILKPGDTFVDRRANVGYFSVLAGRLVGPEGKVLAIEANPDSLRLLQRNLRANGFGEAVHCALTSHSGDVDLFIPTTGAIYSSLRVGGLAKGEGLRSFKVPGRMLDEIVASVGLKKINLLKIDIEGGELDVLASARKILDQYRPLVLIEYSTKTWPAFHATPQRLKDLMNQQRYSISQITFDGRFAPVGENVWNKNYVNLALIPRERENEFSSLAGPEQSSH